jgi:hypothetical protein
LKKERISLGRPVKGLFLRYIPSLALLTVPPLSIPKILAGFEVFPLFWVNILSYLPAFYLVFSSKVYKSPLHKGDTRGSKLTATRIPLTPL